MYNVYVKTKNMYKNKHIHRYLNTKIYIMIALKANMCFMMKNTNRIHKQIKKKKKHSILENKFYKRKFLWKNVKGY